MSRRVLPILLVSGCLGGLLPTAPLSAQLVNVAPLGTATQSTNYPCCGGFPAELAIDLDLNNFTATAGDDPAPSWQVVLDKAHSIKKIIAYNRRGCCPERLRDLTFTILDAAGGASQFQSELLNPGNILGNPAQIELDLVALTGGGVTGLVVQVVRTPDPLGAGDDAAVLSLGEVEVLTDDAVLPLVITDQPVGGRAELGASFSMSVQASGPDPRTYQWKKGPANIDGAIADTLELTDIEASDAGIYTVVVSGGGQTVESDPAELVVVPVNLARSGLAIQSSTFGCCPGFAAVLAIDNNYGNFTATDAPDEHATWEVDLGADAEIDEILAFNRGDGCCQSRLRDIIISIHDVSFLEDPASIPVYESDLLNEENILGGGTTDGPPFLGVQLTPAVSGRYVRIARLPDPDLSGTGGVGNPDEANLLSMGEVEVHGRITNPCPNAGDKEFGDTHCGGLTVDAPVGGGPGVYTASVTATDDSGGAILYTFKADNGFNPPVIIGPSPSSTAEVTLTAAGRWTITSTVDDSLLCDDAATDAVCTTVVDIAPPDGPNKALLRPARQSTNFGGAGFPAPIAVDGNLGNFTATDTNDPAPTWEVDLLSEINIATIAVYNRGDGCCQSRLRDITVSILNAAGDEVFASELLNPENVLGGGTIDGPPALVLEVSKLVGSLVKGRYVRVTRTPDPDLSGTGGQGNADEANVLSIGEVEVYDQECGAGAARCSTIEVTGPAGNLPGNYTVAATGIGDPIFYTFTADDGQNPPVVIGPTDFNSADISLSPGDWTISVQVGDQRHCRNTDPGAVCTQQLTVEPLCRGTNVALQGTAAQTTDYPCCGGFPAGMAIDGDLNTFTATDPADTAPSWQVNLGAPININTIVLHNRVGCCPERLRDITVFILDATGTEIEFQSDLLNPGNSLGSPDYIAVDLDALAGRAVNGQIVRVDRLPDSLSTGDDAFLLSLGEVEVCSGDAPPPPRFRRGDVDNSGVVDITDPINNLTYQFLGQFSPTCLDALDDDDSGTIDISDPIYSLTRQFLGGPAHPAPGSEQCGVDPTADAGAPDGKNLGCNSYSAPCAP